MADDFKVLKMGITSDMIESFYKLYTTKRVSLFLPKQRWMGISQPLELLRSQRETK